MRWMLTQGVLTQICDAVEQTSNNPPNFIGFICVLANATSFRMNLGIAVDTVIMPEYSWYAINTLVFSNLYYKNDDNNVVMKSKNAQWSNYGNISYITANFDVYTI